MLKILWKRGEIAPEEQFLLLCTIFCYLMLDCYVKTGIRISLRDKRVFEITEVEITRVDCTMILFSRPNCLTSIYLPRICCCNGILIRSFFKISASYSEQTNVLQ